MKIVIITGVVLRKRKRNCFCIPMSINDCVKMIVFLCLICFSIYAKMQGFRDKYIFPFYTEVQDGRPIWQENNFWEKSPDNCADTLGIKKFHRNRSILHRFRDNCAFAFTQKLKMAWKRFLGENCQLTMQIPFLR